MREHVLAAQVDGGQVDLLDPAQRVDSGGQDRVVVGRGDAGVIERDVDPAELGGDRVEKVAHVLLAGDVSGDEAPAHLVGSGLPGALVDVDGDDPGALRGHPAGTGQPDAAASSGDDGNPVLQALHYSSFLCRCWRLV